jgi:hypothetical protein
MKCQKIFYDENKETHIATGNVISEDELFITINDKFDGIIKIGKKFIIKMKDVIDDGYTKTTK